LVGLVARLLRGEGDDEARLLDCRLLAAPFDRLIPALLNVNGTARQEELDRERTHWPADLAAAVDAAIFSATPTTTNSTSSSTTTTTSTTTDDDHGRDGEVVWVKVGEYFLQMSEHSPTTRLHLIEAFKNQKRVFLDHMDPASAAKRKAMAREMTTNDKLRDELNDGVMQLHDLWKEAERAIYESQEPVLLNGGDVIERDITWIWPGRIALRRATIFDGDPGLGKSLVMIDIVARLTTGRDMPDGAPNPFGEPVPCLILTAEDTADDVVVPRLRLAGGDPKLLTFLPGIKSPSGERVPNLEDVPALRKALVKTSARFMVIDPLTAYIPATTNAWRDDSARRLLVPIFRLCEELEVALAPVRHLNKSDSTAAAYRGQGSIAFGAAMRGGFLFGHAPEDPSRVMMAPIKVNLAAKAMALTYQIVEPHPGALHPVVRWDAHQVDMDADGLLAALSKSAKQKAAHDATPVDSVPGAREEASSVLRQILANGPELSKEAYRQAREVGIERHTFERAKADQGVTSRKDGPGGAWRFHPPKTWPTP
jgi:RecA-family ATPase